MTTQAKKLTTKQLQEFIKKIIKEQMEVAKSRKLSRPKSKTLEVVDFYTIQGDILDNPFGYGGYVTASTHTVARALGVTVEQLLEAWEQLDHYEDIKMTTSIDEDYVTIHDPQDV